MQFVYKPEGAKKPKKWDFDPDRLMSPEAEAIERHTGFTFAEWTEKVQAGSMLALHGLLFVMLKRDEPTLKWDSVQFNLSMVDFELDDKETADLIGDLEKQAAESPLSPAQSALLESLKSQQEPGPKED